MNHLELMGFRLKLPKAAEPPAEAGGVVVSKPLGFGYYTLILFWFWVPIIATYTKKGIYFFSGSTPKLRPGVRVLGFGFGVLGLGFRVQGWVWA